MSDLSDFEQSGQSDVNINTDDYEMYLIENGQEFDQSNGFVSDDNIDVGSY